MGKQIREPDGVLFCASADLQLKYNPLRESEHAMNASFEEKLVDVWRQVLVENATVVELGGKHYSVWITSRKGLRRVDFVLDGNEVHGKTDTSRSRYLTVLTSPFRASIHHMMPPRQFTLEY
jgi:hypothetical protein